MVAQQTHLNGKDHIVTGIKEVPVTQQRPPAVDLDNFVKNPGVSRVNVAPSKEKPEGMPDDELLHVTSRLERLASDEPPAVQAACACTVPASCRLIHLRPWLQVETALETGLSCSSMSTFGTRTKMALFTRWTHSGLLSIISATVLDTVCAGRHIVDWSLTENVLS